VTLSTNSGLTNSSNQFLLFEAYTYEYCVTLGDEAVLDLVSLNNSLNTESASESYYRIFDENLNAVDSLVATDLVLNQNDLVNLFGYSALGQTSLSFFVSQRNFDNNFPLDIDAEYAGCEGALREFVINVNSIPSKPDTTLFTGLRTDYYLCSGDNLNNIETPREDGIVYRWYLDAAGVPSATQISVAAFNDQFIKQSELTAVGFSNLATTSSQTYTYWVTQITDSNLGTNFAGCESEASKVTVTVFPDPTTPLVDGASDVEFSYCVGEQLAPGNTTMIIVGQPGSRFSYYESNSSRTRQGSSQPLKNGNVIEDGVLELSSLDLFFSNVSVNDTKYYLISQANNVGPNGSDFEGCETDVADMSYIKINIYDIPEIPKVTGKGNDLSVVFREDEVASSGIFLTTEAKPDEKVNWYADFDNDNVLDSDVPEFVGSSATAADLGLAGQFGGGFYKFLITQTQDIGGGVAAFEGCESGALSITILEVPNAPLAIDPDPSCNDLVTQNSIGIKYTGVNNEIGSNDFIWYDDQMNEIIKTNPGDPGSENTYTRDWRPFASSTEAFSTTVYVSQRISLDDVSSESTLSSVNVSIQPRPLIVIDNGNNEALQVLKSCETQEVIFELKLDNLTFDEAEITWFGGRSEPGVVLTTGITTKIDANTLQYSFFPKEENSQNDNTFREGNNFIKVEIANRLAPDNLDNCLGESSRVFEIGSTPEPEMKWEGITKGHITDFIFRDVNRTVSANYQINEVKIDIEGVTLTSDKVLRQGETDTLSYIFEEPGTYKVEAYFLSNSFCDSTIIRYVTILDELTLTSNSNQVYDFENGAQGWLADSSSADGWTLRSSIFWQLGAESATYGSGTQLNTSSYWATNLGAEYPSNEDGWIYSPTFDLSQMSLPTVAFSNARELTTQDGVALQYTLDDGRSWQLLGDYNATSLNSTGKNWYSAEQITGLADIIDANINPARDGWNAQQGWVVSAHKLTNWEMVRFRFAFGSTSGLKTDLDGFAIDNFRIYNRDKTVLVEQFSSLNDAVSLEAMETIRNRFNEYIGTDAIFLNYFAKKGDVDDPLNLRNSNDPGARIAYYGISNTPKSILSGEIRFNNPLSADANVRIGWDVNDFNAISLDEKGFSIGEIIIGGSEQEIEISATFTSEIDLSKTDTELSFRFAIVEDIVGESINTDYGIDTIHNVLRKMLPSSGGFTYVGAVAKGQTDFGIELKSTWNISDVYNTERLKVILFVQLDTFDPIAGFAKGTILQAKEVNVPTGKIIPTASNITSIIPFKLDEFNVHPNPSDKYSRLSFSSEVTDDTNWVIYDQSGRQVAKGIISKNQLAVDIDVSSLPSGIYMVNVYNDQMGTKPKRLIVVH
ncbi:MAG: hypothetical protein ACJA08_002766, partial [Cyclobacteriaceae bacterium]